jgi:site-specific recombinase XerD
MSVKLREKKLKNGYRSLYLDIYDSNSGKRSYEFLKLRIRKPARTTSEQDSNKEILEIARKIRTNRELDLFTRGTDYIPKYKGKISLIKFAEKVSNEKSKLGSVKGYLNSKNKIAAYLNDEDIPIEKVNKKWCEEYYSYLLEEVDDNTAYDYFTKLSHFLNQAVKKEIIPSNPARDVERKKIKESKVTFLTIEEIRKLYETPCKRPQLKQAFLFSCYTGLRWSDIEKLDWESIKHSEQLGYFIDYQVFKSDKYDILPISEQSYSLLNHSGQKKGRIFPEIYYSTVVMNDLKMWVLRAGIDKHVTFHVARHTFATLLLTYGGELKVVSKLMAHSKVSTTERYAKVIDSLKRETVNKLPNIFD